MRHLLLLNLCFSNKDLVLTSLGILILSAYSGKPLSLLVFN